MKRPGKICRGVLSGWDSHHYPLERYRIEKAELQQIFSSDND